MWRYITIEISRWTMQWCVAKETLLQQQQQNVSQKKPKCSQICFIKVHIRRYIYKYTSKRKKLEWLPVSSVVRTILLVWTKSIFLVNHSPHKWFVLTAFTDRTHTGPNSHRTGILRKIQYSSFRNGKCTIVGYSIGQGPWRGFRWLAAFFFF